MSQEKQVKTLDQLKEGYNMLTIHEKAILNYCKIFSQSLNSELSTPISSQSEPKEIKFTPLCLIDFKVFKNEVCFAEINNKTYGELLDNLINIGYIELSNSEENMGFRLPSFRLQTFLYSKSNEFEALLDEYETDEDKSTTNEFGSTLVSFRDGSREFFTNPLDI